MAYWDTSALVKLYVDEPDSPQYRQILRESLEPLHTSILSLAELYKVFWSKAVAHGLSHGGPDALLQMISEAVEKGHMRLISATGSCSATFVRSSQLAMLDRDRYGSGQLTEYTWLLLALSQPLN